MAFVCHAFHAIKVLLTHLCNLLLTSKIFHFIQVEPVNDDNYKFKRFSFPLQSYADFNQTEADKDNTQMRLMIWLPLTIRVRWWLST